ncbi:uncharacterized protein LOC123004436 [Tribolium madens]|uniref:uncharacterized protein LOC123004436 n=1 Tax=Tribolium madens TaxID=41895 RepID=UPI001CF72680|nr:uncharacterized protein LOC123004436 [Tribolium madens]XP_044253645.1 uncharacterized protein LOC123004436 [Tribolium madens]
MYYIVIREYQPNDFPSVSEVVRNAYISNVLNAFVSALFNEVTFQAIVLLAAFMFIFMGVPLQYCLLSVPIVLIMLYILIYGSFLMKAAELMHSKRALQCWVAEAYEPYFFTEKPQNCFYKIIPEEKFLNEGINDTNYRKRIVGTCAVMKHNLSEDWSWLFRLAVNERYRKKGIGLMLTQTAQNWSRIHRFDYMELVITECQEEARQLFNNAGFEIKQMYHKRLFTSAFTLQMFQLRAEVRSTFK